jgi:DNA-binding transcriptional LysR family regulator
MRNLDLSILRTFVAIADKESFAAAADHVSRTQSAVSQQMQRLEELLGYDLFKKKGRTKVLTENGVKVRDYARRIVELNDELMSTAAAGGKFTVLRVGACYDVTETFLSLLLQKVAKAHPNILLEVHSERSPFLMDALAQGNLDLAITTRSDDSFISETLRVTPTVWICADGFAFDPSRPLPLVLPDEPSLFRSLAIEALEGAGKKWFIAYLGLNLGAVRAAVRAGLGVTARSLNQVAEDMRVLGSAEDMPPMPDVTFKLFMRPRDKGTMTEKVFETLRVV